MNAKKVISLLKRLERDIESVVYEAMKKNMSPQQIKRSIEYTLDQYNLNEKIMKELGPAFKQTIDLARAAAEEKYKWVKDHTVDPEKTKPAQDIIKRVQNDFAKAGGLIETKVVDSVMLGIRQGETFKQIQDRLIHSFKQPIAQAFTVANTALAAYDTVSTLAYACEAGVAEMKYSGPATRRPFCMSELGKIRSLEEWASMKNASGQSALVYRGGWNCRHWLEPVVSNVIPKPGDIEKSMAIFNKLKVAA